MAVTITIIKGAVRDILRGQEMLADLRRRAQAIADAAGDGNEVDSQVGRNRARASVRTATREAMHREAKDRSLTRAIDAGRR